MSITKNHQTPETLQALCSAAFPGRTVSTATELTEGMFNTAYRIDFADGGASVLKIAAANATGLMSNEINMMQAEVSAMKLLRAAGIPHVARVQHADFSRTLCSGSCFFMECLPGQSLSSLRDALSPAETDHILQQVGRFQRRLTEIHGDSFGLLGDTRRFPTLYGLIRFLLQNVLKDAFAVALDLGFTGEEVLCRLEEDQPAFHEVQTPSLVHWDMWEGNIFVQEGELSGVIDWERAMWGEPLMDDRFRRHTRKDSFLAGFGQTVFTPAELRRLAWYDLFLYLTMATEGFYRGYEDIPGTLNWVRPLLNAAWADVCSR